MPYPAPEPHDPPKEIGEDLFVVHGAVKMLPIMRITRNMTIVRNGTELTLIHPVRLNDEGLHQLDALGEVKHVLRLGPYHGMDDRFYVDHYKAKMWSFEGGTTYPEPKITNPLTAGGELPFPNAKLFAFDHVNQPEGVVLLEREATVLLTCDCIQSYSTPPHMPHTAWLTQKLMPFLGFTRKTIIGPIWVKRFAKDPAGLKSEFERLLALDFDQLLSAHGTFVEQGAHAEVEAAFEDMYGAS